MSQKEGHEADRTSQHGLACSSAHIHKHVGQEVKERNCNGYLTSRQRSFHGLLFLECGLSRKDTSTSDFKHYRVFEFSCHTCLTNFPLHKKQRFEASVLSGDGVSASYYSCWFSLSHWQGILQIRTQREGKKTWQAWVTTARPFVQVLPKMFRFDIEPLWKRHTERQEVITGEYLQRSRVLWACQPRENKAQWNILFCSSVKQEQNEFPLLFVKKG